MQAPRSKRSLDSSRAFVVSLLAFTALIAYSLVIRPALFGSQNDAARLSARSLADQDLDCRAVHRADDQCAFILANCEDDEAGLIHYLSFYYCTLGTLRPLALTIIILWGILLFMTIGIAASDFFSINLSTIATILGLSENLAGVTFLAFGNGSPDVFSTFAAMRSNSGSMAIGELIGAAGFITAVVAGSMGVAKPFKVSKRTFVRDIVFFIVAISFTMVFLADGALHLWECFIMIGFYVTYVFVVVGWHWYTVRRRRQRRKEVEARIHMLGGAGQDGEDLEPYRDESDDEEGPVGRQPLTRSAPDLSALERGPRIEVDGELTPGSSHDDDEERREMHAAAEMTSSMRVNRPRWGRSNTTITPTRPSLVGALEFRGIISTLQRASNLPLRPLQGRDYADHAQQLTGALERSATAILEERGETVPAGRERARSHGNIPLNVGFSEAISQDPSPGVGRTTSSTIDGRLAPPSPAMMTATSGPRTPERPQLKIPAFSRGSSIRSSPSLSPFPDLTESPGALTPLPPNEDPAVFSFPVPSDRRLSTARPVEDYEEGPKPVRWWPYRVLPPPHILLSTIFPTLQGWKEKRWWDRLLSLVMMPSMFVLVTTLPVVDIEDKGLADDDLTGLPEAVQPGSAIVPVPAVETIEAEPEEHPEAAAWQEYRRRTKSVSSRSPRSPGSRSPRRLSQDTRGEESASSSAQASHRPSPNLPVPQLASSSAAEPDHATTSSADEDSVWNRWLVALQIFTGPLFVVFIMWANTYEDMENPKQELMEGAAYSLLFSCCSLALLLFLTSPDRKPKYHFVLCFLGFVISVAWISTIAGEVVGVLKAIGVICNISEAILGLTLFAVGNSLGDWVADVTVARLGFPVMALAACFGGPMLNILLGIGIGGAFMSVSSANEKHNKHPGRPIHYKPYHIQVSGTLLVSAIGLLITLLLLLIAVPSNKWMMDRKIGWTLIGIWVITLLVNVGVEWSGKWSDVA